MTRPRLSPRQQKFVAGVLAGTPAEAAYVDAGYAARNGSARAAASRLLTNVNVSQAIEAANVKAAERAELSAEWVIEKLRDEAEDHGEGSSHSARVRALELLGRRFHLFPDKQIVAGDADAPLAHKVYRSDAEFDPNSA